MNEHKRIDLHSHTILSDGVLLPSELLRRAAVLGHKALAITDHVDAGNMGYVIESLVRLVRVQGSGFITELLVGVELTHVDPGNIAKLAIEAKQLGAEVVVVHGETIVEPVARATNRAAVECPAVDLLAHPGFLTSEEAELATARGCFIEITARKGHSLTNGHVARICRQTGAKMVLNTDAHGPSDLATFQFARQVAAGAGLSEDEIQQATHAHPQQVLDRVLDARRGYRKA